jgi:PAS domain S-box-containing protein
MVSATASPGPESHAAQAAPATPPLRGAPVDHDATEEQWNLAADLETVLSSIGDHAVLALDGEGRVKTWDAGAQQMIGYRRDDILGRQCACFFGADDQARELPRETLRLAREVGNHSAEGWRVRHDGSRFWAQAVTRPLVGLGGQLRGFIMVMRDMTASRDAAATLAENVHALRATNRLLLRTEAAMHVGHWRMDVRTGMLEWSAELFRICGWPNTRAPSWRGAVDAYHPDDRGRIDRAMREAIDSGIAGTVEARLIRPRGDVRHVVFRVEADPPRAGAVATLLGTLQDVTERHWLESSLREAQKLETVGRVSARIAHDLSTLLAGAAGELDSATDDGSEAAQHRAYAAAAVRRACAVTEGLLTYARRQVLKPERVGLADLLEETARGLAATLPKGVMMEFSCDPLGLEVEIDPRHLRTALHNLALNGCEAMRRGGVLSLRARRTETDVVITVADSGSGMDQATLSQAAEPFFSTKDIAGAGLGLTIAQEFARQSGGDLRIASVPGRGTQAELALPLPSSTTHADPEVRRVPAMERLLLVDDVADVLVISAAFLRGAGFDVAFASSGDEALARISAGERFDALVADYALPGLNGIELILQARQLRPELPALLISGFTDIAEVDALPEGVALMTKPFQRRDFVAALRHAIRRQEMLV